MKRRKVRQGNKHALKFATRHKYRSFPTTSVVSVNDGGTVVVDLDIGFSLKKTEKVKLSGVIAPLIRTKSVEEKNFGIIAKNRLTELLASAIRGACLECVVDGIDKYGCHTGVFYTNDKESINAKLLNEGLVWPEADGRGDLEYLRTFQSE